MIIVDSSMKKTLLLPLMFLALASCSDKFGSVKEGMTTEEMKLIVGEPDSVRNDFFSDVWFYDTHIVSVENDHVTMVRSKAEIRAEMRQMQKEIENLPRR